MRRGPGVGVFAAPAHAHKGGLGRQPVLCRQEFVPSIPGTIRLQVLAGLNVGDVKTTPEKFNFRLRLVIPITAAPGPGIARRRALRANDKASSSASNLMFDAIPLVGGRFGGLDCQRLLVDEEVVPIKLMPACLFAGEAWRRRLAGHA